MLYCEFLKKFLRKMTMCTHKGLSYSTFSESHLHTSELHVKPCKGVFT